VLANRFGAVDMRRVVLVSIFRRHGGATNHGRINDFERELAASGIVRRGIPAVATRPLSDNPAGRHTPYSCTARLQSDQRLKVNL
jgi:hypothetical protein